jgi:hypothetical protein
MERMNSRTMTSGTLGAMRLGLAVALLAVATSPWDAGAQPRPEPRDVARLKSVNGNVLVSREAGLAAGAQAERLVNGSRVITTANSDAIVEFDDGCEVHLKENERYEVDSGRACALRLAESLAPSQAAAAAPLALFLLPVIPTAFIVDEVTRNDPVSPN